MPHFNPTLGYDMSIWTEGLDNLKIFIDYLNNIHPTIKLASSHSSTDAPFLDVNVSSWPIKLQSKLTFDLLYFFSQLGFRIEMKAIPHLKGYEMGFQKFFFCPKQPIILSITLI